MVTNPDIQIAMTRRDKNDYYLGIARSISFGSKCPEGKQHGCVAVKHSRIVATGYNGVAAGHKHCNPCHLDEYKKRHRGKKDFSVCPAVHAEINTIVTAGMIGIAIVESIFYVTKEPCADCLKALRNMHLAGIIFLDDLSGDHWLLMGPMLVEKVRLIYGEY